MSTTFVLRYRFTKHVHQSTITNINLELRRWNATLENNNRIGWFLGIVVNFGEYQRHLLAVHPWGDFLLR
jgi:hypothetical protein